MKIAVISDTHSIIDECVAILSTLKDIDLIIHLGDYASDAARIKEELKIKMINVKGNCDYFDTFIKDEEVIEVNNKKILITHGHNYGVKYNINRLYYRGKELEVDIVLFGHTHTPLNIVENDMVIFNPGSISKPRGNNKKSYGIIEINEEVKVDIIYV